MNAGVQGCRRSSAKLMSRTAMRLVTTLGAGGGTVVVVGGGVVVVGQGGLCGTPHLGAASAGMQAGDSNNRARISVRRAMRPLRRGIVPANLERQSHQPAPMESRPPSQDPERR